MDNHWKPLMERFQLNKIQTDTLYHIANQLQWSIGEVINEAMVQWILKNRGLKKDDEKIKQFIHETTR